MLIFLSYTRPSRDLVRALTKDLEALGNKVWFDEELIGGQAWWSDILVKIRECELFAVGLAPETLDSQACKLECTYAAGLGKRILPILLTEGVSMNLLPTTLSEIQCVDYRRQDKQAFVALSKALGSLPAARSLPQPLPEPPPAPVSYLNSLKEQIEAPASLSLPEQTVLVLKLRERWGEADARDDVRKLLSALRRRDDLFAKVAAEIEVILGGAPKTPVAPAQPPPTSGSADRGSRVEETSGRRGDTPCGKAAPPAQPGPAPRSKEEPSAESAKYSAPARAPTSSSGLRVVKIVGGLLCTFIGGPLVLGGLFSPFGGIEQLIPGIALLAGAVSLFKKP